MSGEPVWRSAVAVGVGGLACALFTFIDPITYRLVLVNGWGLLLLLVLSVAAVSGGLLRSQPVVTAAGAGFVLAAALELVSWAGSDWLDGDGSTISLFAGLGVGLLALALAPRSEVAPGQPARSPAASRPGRTGPQGERS